MNIIGSLINKNVFILGFTGNSQAILNNPELKDYYYLSKKTLKDYVLSQEEIVSKFNFTDYFILSELQNKIVSSILSLVDSGVKRIIFDDVLLLVDRNVKNKIFELLNNNNINFVNISSDLEDALYTDYMLVFFNNSVAIEGNTLDVLKEEKLLNRLGYNLPFLVDLSIQLKYYNLVDKIYLNPEELVEKLWN